MNTQNELDIPRIHTIVTAVASALDYSHSRGVYHHDVKTGSIMISDERILLFDFGIATWSQTDIRAVLKGAVVCASPERIDLFSRYRENQLTPEKDLLSVRWDRSDQYSLGTLAYELLTGELYGILPDVLQKTPNGYIQFGSITYTDYAKSLASDQRSSFDPIFDRVLAKNPEMRFASCTEFVQKLSEVL